MKLNFKTMPIGSLPYTDDKLCKQMMLSLFEDIPYLPELPLINSKDSIFYRTIENISCISGNIKGVRLNISPDVVSPEQALTDRIYNQKDYSGIDKFCSTSEFMSSYLNILNRLRPKETIIRLYGPFSLLQLVLNIEMRDLLNEQAYRKYIIQSYVLKSVWFIKQIKQASPETVPLILFDEPLLCNFAAVRRANESIKKESLLSLYQKIFQKIHQEGGYVGVQSFEKCNWQNVIDSGVDMISFDAYNNPTSLNIIVVELNKFLARGGYINWGFIPVETENLVRNLRLSELEDRLIKAMENLACVGVNSELIINNSTLSVLGDMSHLPLLYAEKATILSKQLGQKMPKSLRSVPPQDPPQ